MKPSAHTSPPFFSVGAPWEIWRTASRVTSGYTIDLYTIDLYTKSGSDGLYNSLLILSPDNGVVISVLAAGAASSTLVSAASEIATQRLLPALERPAVKTLARFTVECTEMKRQTLHCE